MDLKEQPCLQKAIVLAIQKLYENILGLGANKYGEYELRMVCFERVAVLSLWTAQHSTSAVSFGRNSIQQY